MKLAAQRIGEKTVDCSRKGRTRAAPTEEAEHETRAELKGRTSSIKAGRGLSQSTSGERAAAFASRAAETQASSRGPNTHAGAGFSRRSVARLSRPRTARTQPGSQSPCGWAPFGGRFPGLPGPRPVGCSLRIVSISLSSHGPKAPFACPGSESGAGPNRLDRHFDAGLPPCPFGRKGCLTRDQRRADDRFGPARAGPPRQRPAGALVVWLAAHQGEVGWRGIARKCVSPPAPAGQQETAPWTARVDRPRLGPTAPGPPGEPEPGFFPVGRAAWPQRGRAKRAPRCPRSWLFGALASGRVWPQDN